MTKVTKEVMHRPILMHRHPKGSQTEYQAKLSTYTNFYFLTLMTPCVAPLGMVKGRARGARIGPTRVRTRPH